MAGKVKKIILRTVACILIFAIVMLAGAYLLLKFYFIPKYNSLLGEDAAQSEMLSEKDVIGFAKYLTDRQVIENIVNFDKSSAKEILNVAKELEAEPEEKPAPRKKVTKSTWSKNVTARVEAIPTPTPAPTPAPAPTSVPKKSQVKGSTAYERIMNTATKEEISAGMAILSKVNMSKVNQLRREGKTSELKKYIKSVLTSAEIKRALQLYGKYKHLL